MALLQGKKFASSNGYGVPFGIRHSAFGIRTATRNASPDLGIFLSETLGRHHENSRNTWSLRALRGKACSHFCAAQNVAR